MPRFIELQIKEWEGHLYVMSGDTAHNTADCMYCCLNSLVDCPCSDSFCGFCEDRGYTAVRGTCARELRRRT